MTISPAAPTSASEGKRNRMPISWRTELPMLLVIAVLCAIAAWSMSTLPDTVPLHWNARGEADGFGSRVVGAWFTPALAAMFYLLLLALARLAPARRVALLEIRFGLLLFIGAMYVAIQLAMHGADFSMTRVALPLLGLLILWLGWAMFRNRPSRTS